jgi:hypothetical protein
MTGLRGDSIPNKGPSPFNDMPAIKMGLEGVYKILNRLQIHKATGPDKIFSCILKEMAAEVAPILHLVASESHVEHRVGFYVCQDVP